MTYILCLASLFFSIGASAANGSYAEAMRVRKLIENETTFDERAAETIKLPVSRGFNQLGTSLCWSYATLSVLETEARVLNSKSKLELSRRAMQYLTMENRYRRYIDGSENFLSERGVSVDAIDLIHEAGLVAFADYKDVADAYGPDKIKQNVDAAADFSQKLTALAHALVNHYEALPEVTHWEGKSVTRKELAEAALGKQTWQSFAAADNGEEGWGKHPDPDARKEAVSWYQPRTSFGEKIKSTLKANHALVVTIGGHVVTLYGADYDESGAATLYYMKDSYAGPGYFYRAKPANLHNSLREVTTITN